MRLWFKKTRASDASPSEEDSAGAPERNSNGKATPVLPSPDSAPLPAAAVDQPRSTDGAGSATGNGKNGTAYKSDHRSLYKQLMAGLYDAVMIADPKGHIIDINSRVTEFFDFTLEETWDMPVSKLVPGINATLLARIQKGLAGERHVLLDGRCMRKDGTTFMAEITISSINLMNDGDLVFCVRNIERRHVQMQRLRSCQSLLNHVLVAAAACDDEGRIKVANAALARLLGYAKSDDMAGKPFSALWDEAGATEAIRRVLKEGATFKETVQAINAAGARLQASLTLAPEHDARRKIVGFLASFAPAAVVSLSAATREK